MGGSILKTISHENLICPNHQTYLEKIKYLSENKSSIKNTFNKIKTSPILGNDYLLKLTKDKDQ
jgi:hypothetical protein